MLDAFRSWCDSNPRLALGIGGGFFLLVVIFFVRSLGGSDLPIADSIAMVCVASGEIYNLDREDVNMFPMTNPKTGERTLVPVRDEDGRKVVPNRFRGLVTDRLKDQNQYVDPDTLALKGSP